VIKPGASAKIRKGEKRIQDWAATQKLHGGAGSHPRLNLGVPIHAKLWYLEFMNTENVFS
jgi:hypothetical protein